MDEPLLIDRYLLFREIASGGMAAIFLARQLGPVGFGRAVAVKRLHPNYARDPDFVAMFVDEARVVTSIRHPNVVPVLDVVANAGHLFLVMEYVHGEAASRLVMTSIRRRMRISPAIVSAIGIGMLEGLHAAHEAKTSSGKALDIVHRDVSPQNVLIGVDGVARMVDFGIAQATSRLHETTVGSGQKGKLKYMAPEQINAQPLDRRADIWAAGVVIWELLAHRRLFTAENDGATIRQILDKPIPPPSSFGGSTAALDAVVARCLRRPAGERFPDARTVALALEAACPPATSREVGEWVAALAGPQLAEREKMLEELDTVSVAGMPSVRTQLAAIADHGTARRAEAFVRPAGLLGSANSPNGAGPHGANGPSAGNGPKRAALNGDDLQPGCVLGGAYSIVRPLGRGGMGTVYEGVQLALARRVAIKVLSDLTAERAARFSLEAMAMAALQHPCIVQVSDFRPGDGEEPPFLVMELLEGRALLEVIREEKKLDHARAVNIAAQILSALATAHKAEIVHRDIKPGNVFVVDHAGVALAKVLDFGIAKMMGDEGGPNTTTGTVFGSLPYMAPERLLDEPVHAKMDVYSTSVLLFEMLAGRRPFEGSTAELTALLAGTMPAPDVRNFEPTVPAALAEIVARGLAKRPVDRWASADAMRDALMNSAGDGGRAAATAFGTTQAVTVASVPPAKSMASRAGRWRVPLVLGLVAGIVGSFGYAFKTGRVRASWGRSPAESAVVSSAAPSAPASSAPALAALAPSSVPGAPSAAPAPSDTAAAASASAHAPSRRPPVRRAAGTSSGDDIHLDHRH